MVTFSKGFALIMNIRMKSIYLVYRTCFDEKNRSSNKHSMGMAYIAKDRKLGPGQGFYKEVCYLTFDLENLFKITENPLSASGKVCARLGHIVWTRVFC